MYRSWVVPASCNPLRLVLQYPHESEDFFMIKVLFVCHGTTLIG